MSIFDIEAYRQQERTASNAASQSTQDTVAEETAGIQDKGKPKAATAGATSDGSVTL